MMHGGDFAIDQLFRQNMIFFLFEKCLDQLTHTEPNAYFFTLAAHFESIDDLRTAFLTLKDKVGNNRFFTNSSGLFLSMNFLCTWGK